ncbi:MAG TPA: hypothetical protein VHM91_05655, partial [Verrucomicrobiales bacterium]|nr:hypothetical protein [Verrucomicrobiales bacterium]
MKFRIITMLALALATHGPFSYGHGMSEEMKVKLNAPIPDWLTVGNPIKAEPTDGNNLDQTALRKLAGDSTSTRDRVKIPGRNIEIKVDYPVDRYYGSSLSPDGTKLIINGGGKSHLYEIHGDGAWQEIGLKVPEVTYDDGPKGFISSWSWADNETLIGISDIDNERGEFMETRSYVFRPRERVLRRLDFSGLNLETTEGLQISRVDTASHGVVITIGQNQFTARADLNAPMSIQPGKDHPPKPKGVKGGATVAL